MRHLVFWAGIALTLPQALWVRQRAPRFTDAAGDPAGRIPGPTPKRLIAIGDSIIAGVGCSTLDRALVGQVAARIAQQLRVGIEWQSIGKTGARTGAIQKLLVSHLPDQPADFILISTGVNDITGLKTLRQWTDALSTLIDTLHTHSPHARIALSGIPPMQCFPLIPQPLRALFGLRARSFDLAARELLAQRGHAVYVPFEGVFRPDQFAPDGYHPSESSCTEIAREVVDALNSD